MKKLFIISFLLFASVISYFYLDFTYSKKEVLGRKIIIKNGESKQSVIRKTVKFNKNILKIYLKIYHKNRTFKAGIYYFEKFDTLKSIFAKYEKGEYKTIKVLIPEGFTIKQIKNRLSQKKLIDIKKFDEVLLEMDFNYYTPNGNYEGYFFPDTYYFYEGESEESIIKKFLKRFENKFPSDKIKDKKSFYKKLVMASIIEKEAYYNKERELIASVFYNRLKKRMRLESCATLEYIFDYKKKKILYSDLKIDSLYNTYRNYGLPPTAISNPGEASIYAVLNPRSTKYFYFVKKEDKSHHFSKTYKEHLKYKKEVKNGSFKDRKENR